VGVGAGGPKFTRGLPVTGPIINLMAMNLTNQVRLLLLLVVI
jgi:hypothetical protein